MVENLAAQLYREAGAKVIGLDPVSIHCEIANKSGIHQVHLNYIQIQGAFEWRLPAFPKEGTKGSIHENPELLWDWAGSGRLHLMDLITHVIQPEELEDAYFRLINKKEEYLGVLIDWRESHPA